MKGEKLDAIEKAREEGKRPYQGVVAIASAAAGAVTAWLINLIMRVL